ncbi:MAG: hypothetical protein ACFE85_20085 [Candidatus Hodarchaeota archaeon]
MNYLIDFIVVQEGRTVLYSPQFPSKVITNALVFGGLIEGINILKN